MILFIESQGPKQIWLAMRKTGCVSLLFTVTLAAQAPESKVMPNAPALPFYDWNACPFEGCAYREWKAGREVAVYNTWKEPRHKIAQLRQGAEVTGITGVVITLRPGVVRLDRDLPEFGLKVGETILTYTYRGEGYSAVWFKGRFYPEFDLTFTQAPNGQGCSRDCAATSVDPGKSVWWAQIRLKGGQTGWVNMEDAVFEGTDMLAFIEGDPIRAE